MTSNAKTIVGGFKSVSGMESETEIIEFRQGQADPSFVTWAFNSAAGRAPLRDFEVTKNVRGVRTTYVLYGAEAISVQAESDGESASIAIEKIELAVERVESAD